MASPKASILFRIPADPAPLARALSDFGVESSDIDFSDVSDMGDADQVAGALHAARAVHGDGFVTIDLIDEPDPLAALQRTCRTIRESGAHFFGVSDAFRERSRGLLCQARVMVSSGPGDIDERIVWDVDRPDIGATTLAKAGFDGETTAAVEAFFFPSTPAPKP